MQIITKKALINKIKHRHQLFYVISMIFIFSSCEQNQYVDGMKDGNWIEYLDSNRAVEVSKDSAFFLRKIKYKKGMPVGMVSDSYIKSKNIKSEFYLISGPYIQNMKRPNDKFTGVVKEFDEKNGKIVNFQYFDQFGIGDPRSFFVKGFDLVNDDNRFDSLYFCSLHNQENKLESLLKYHNRPDLFDNEAASIVTKGFTNPSIKKLIKEDKNNIFLYSYLMDALSENGKYFKIFFDLEKQMSLNIKNKQQQEKLYNVSCSWCGRIVVLNYNPITTWMCSLKCEAENKIYQANKRYR